MSICKAAGCPNKKSYKLYCPMHYQRMKAHDSLTFNKSSQKELYIRRNIKAWAKLYENGASVLDISRLYKVHQSTVYRYLANTGVNMRDSSLIRLGSKNANWKGDNVGYGGLHKWIKRRLRKPSVCSECHIKPPIDLANISQEYKRDLSDWEWLCRKCHMVKDGRLDQLVNRG